jgi:hypothetical protein
MGDTITFDQIVAGWHFVSGFAGPLALLASLLALYKSMRDIAKIREETRKLADERITSQVTREKMQVEIAKLTRDIRALDASAISNEIIARKALFNHDRVIECLSVIAEEANSIYSELLDAYKVFYQPRVRREDLKKAWPAIRSFIDGRHHRGTFDRHERELVFLLRQPLYQTIGDELIRVIENFHGRVILSRQEDFKQMIEKADFQLAAEQIEEVREWMEKVREDYDYLSPVIGMVESQVRIRTAQGEDPAKVERGT